MLRVCFNCYGNYTTDSVYQWDLNHTLQITGISVTNAPTVHFTNKKRETAIVVQSKLEDDVISVPVPNEIVQDPYNIVAYVHIYDNNHAKTIETVNIPLKKRAKPDDYQFIDNVDVMNFERLEKDMTDVKQDILDFEIEMNTTLQLCRDAVSALQLEYRNMDGGTPTTEAELYDDSYNGGYPVANN